MDCPTLCNAQKQRMQRLWSQERNREALAALVRRAAGAAPGDAADARLTPAAAGGEGAPGGGEAGKDGAGGGGVSDVNGLFRGRQDAGGATKTASRRLLLSDQP
jgi:hypothetical protein